jgi:hypothetical protein
MPAIDTSSTILTEVTSGSWNGGSANHTEEKVQYPHFKVGDFN